MAEEMESYSSVFKINNWDALMHRYNPKYMPQIKKAIDSPEDFLRRWNLKDWKQVGYDKAA